MFKEAKQILNYLFDNKIISFSKIYNAMNLSLSERDQKSLESFLIDNNYVENSDDGGGPFGVDEEYNITDDGKQYCLELNDADDLDKILKHLNENEGVYVDFEFIVRQVDVVKSDTLEIKLEHSGFVQVVADKTNKHYGINDEGKLLIASGGMKQQYANEIRKSLSKTKHSMTKSATPAAPLRDRVLQVLYETYKSGKEGIDAKDVAEVLGEDSRKIFDLLIKFVKEGLATNSDKWVKVGNVNNHVYFYSITQKGISAMESKDQPQPIIQHIQTYINAIGDNSGIIAGSVNNSGVLGGKIENTGTIKTKTVNNADKKLSPLEKTGIWITIIGVLFGIGWAIFEYVIK